VLDLDQAAWTNDRFGAASGGRARLLLGGSRGDIAGQRKIKEIDVGEGSVTVPAVGEHVATAAHCDARDEDTVIDHGRVRRAGSGGVV
jgi:hypothetical protein